MMTNDPLLTSDEAAEFLGVSRRTSKVGGFSAYRQFSSVILPDPYAIENPIWSRS